MMEHNEYTKMLALRSKRARKIKRLDDLRLQDILSVLEHAAKRGDSMAYRARRLVELLKTMNQEDGE